MIGQCAWCGSEFVETRRRRFRQRFCTPKCRKASWEARSVAERVRAIVGHLNGESSAARRSDVVNGVSETVLGVVVQNPKTGQVRTVRHG